MARLAPSVLSADFARLAEQLRACEEAGADLIHVDVMDGRFVPNISLGVVVVEALKRSTRLFLDVHLMIVEPERHIEAFAKAGADGITIHAEATPHAHRAIEQIHSLGKQAGLAINPATPLDFFKPVMPALDLALLMAVNPGFGGQKFIPESLARLQDLKSLRDSLNPRCLIEVDGGINAATAAQVVAAGADILVAGTAVFSGDIKSNIDTLRSSLASSR